VKLIPQLQLCACTLCLVFAVSAQGLAQQLAAADGSPESSHVTTKLAVPGDKYVIGNEDVLNVSVWKEPDISRIVPVRPDGKITLPLVGEIQASGITPLQLQAHITDGLRAYVSNPDVTVIVQEVKSLKFNIVGEITKPGSYVLTEPMTVLDAIAAGGGLRDFAKGSRIYVLRANADGSRSKLPFDYKNVIKGKRVNDNIELHPGDTIVVP
jgi:polysaccharide export outer membrane protein